MRWHAVQDDKGKERDLYDNKMGTCPGVYEGDEVLLE